ncbi:MAG: type II secretion system F family protein [Bdellovibrionales bacterium]|nr:type II secretion system F family protein [Bdellovibrionales bacterium]MBT3526097.1 type II secretion system F family protein [Bdellovibrionales bacterium]MBT7766950.1 type II secretion system F family protein [Bdellovibrionales bacterium]
MGKWKFEGVDKLGALISGELEAKNERDARRQLRSQKIRAKKLRAPSILEFDISTWMADKGLTAPFGERELLSFTKQLLIMHTAGISSEMTFDLLHKQEKNVTLKKAIQSIGDEVTAGQPMSAAMRRHTGFTRIYCNLIRAGEEGGTLEEMLEKLIEHMDKSQKIRAKIKSAMTYPIIVLFIGVIVVYGLMVFVVPQFTDMLADSGQEMPGITQFVIDISNWLQEWSIYMVPGLIVLFIIIKAVVSQGPGKLFLDQLKRRLPYLGELVIKGNLASFFRTYGTLSTSGVSELEALDISISTIDNSLVASDFRVVRRVVEGGGRMSDQLKKITYFPELTSQMIVIGEESGKMAEVLAIIINTFEEDVDDQIKIITQMIEPAILVFLGGVVAVILLAMYMPIFASAGGAG